MEQAQKKNFCGHSSFALQLPAHLTASRPFLLQENRMLAAHSDGKEKKPVSKPLVWHLANKKHWTAQLDLRNNSLQIVHCTFPFCSILLSLTQGRHSKNQAVFLSHTYTYLPSFNQHKIHFFLIFNFSYWPELVAFYVTCRPICKMFRLNFKFKTAQERFHCIILQLLCYKFKHML